MGVTTKKPKKEVTLSDVMEVIVWRDHCGDTYSGPSNARPLTKVLKDYPIHLDITTIGWVIHEDKTSVFLASSHHDQMGEKEEYFSDVIRIMKPMILSRTALWGRKR